MFTVCPRYVLYRLPPLGDKLTANSYTAGISRSLLLLFVIRSLKEGPQSVGTAKSSHLVPRKNFRYFEK
ncbi:hypothetical protein NY2A_b527R [Paramecium bursaria Chlorella virus NY2A]|uniref:Uncharacterized protein b527R n=1 Tax=Paramecium bursaria Chlorella virus NY2A TaxID=46021 RepID=A7IX52_PBCVN|nr:hypothetical protein NY2A_b527R [Paramecium bursaria Chlorella virus NY2A]YP_001498550.1 hypothetical protein AR158_C469R [Paramecium bursaria Chlorella virus AR158]ABT14926.1 hypothetical protein NY2A_b527R [Paramecium bursaria Chlorella virus NY2A]ABU44014.1 hypothetical protein AR158_C469R [Paramecium bursaria Chlorella virus AR158]